MKITNFPAFTPSFNKLIENQEKRFLIEFYHYDFNSEPFLYTDCYVQDIIMEKVPEHGLIITIFTPYTTISLSERNHFTNISDEAVVFSSKHDDESYCIINFS